jgi:hypothetical protein
MGRHLRRPYCIVCSFSGFTLIAFSMAALAAFTAIRDCRKANVAFQRLPITVDERSPARRTCPCLRYKLIGSPGSAPDGRW